jgi:hypothetical protein
LKLLGAERDGKKQQEINRHVNLSTTKREAQRERNVEKWGKYKRLFFM